MLLLLSDERERVTIITQRKVHQYRAGLAGMSLNTPESFIFMQTVCSRR